MTYQIFRLNEIPSISTNIVIITKIIMYTTKNDSTQKNKQNKTNMKQMNI